MSTSGIGPSLPRLPDLDAAVLRAASVPAGRPVVLPQQGGTGETPALEVEVNSFIPQDQVSTPWFVPGGGTFAGDGRSLGEDGTQRTQQTIQVYEDPSAPGGYRVEIDADTGETHRLGDDGEVIETGEASESDLQAEVVEVREDGTIVVQLTGQSPNPLVGVAPGITYDVTVEMRPNPDGTWTVTTSGDHDAFPGYEVLATVDGGDQQLVYGYDPNVSGASPISLAQGDGGLPGLIWGDSGVSVEGSLTVGADTLAPADLVERHTDADGNVDVVALGTDLAGNAETGNVDADFVESVFASLPEDQREGAANAFFDNLSTTPGGGVSPWHDDYATLALTPAGMDVILAVGAHAPERLAADEIVYAFAAQNRDAIHAGDPAASATASAFLDALADSPEAQQSLAGYLEPIYDDDRTGIASTPEGRALQDRIERALG
ncbi:DUF3238 domain-containing protein [Luteimonas kalidii]|uniref:DUF3238 domain-containing protein n=1 Tax=Luteimonas kalidii TaxID=3042025 RepID=A0ABT6JRU2_9GAMM|nr:DUF3238 domain-containing protein [Luteimonas kalidii]MDH5833410.1 DUF3238 domain-containing protein [Luteimonas kalidii]